jgi:lysozyme
MRVSNVLIAFIKKTENCELTAYKDSAGVWTIGYGHTAGVSKGDKISKFQAEEYLREDIRQFELIADEVKNLNTQGRYDAVVDFLYNCGPANFKTSTLKKYIEGGYKTWKCQEEFLKWVNARDPQTKKLVKLGGLVSRRIWEAARFAE